MHGSSLSNRLDFQYEQWKTVRPEIAPVWLRHNNEIAADDDKVQLEPDMQKFDALAKRDEDHWVTVRWQGGIVGYAFVIVTTHMHRKNQLCGFYDLYWLDPAWRKGTRAGRRLLDVTDETLRLRGVKKIYIGTKVWKNIGLLLERRGYTQTEIIYTKAI